MAKSPSPRYPLKVDWVNGGNPDPNDQFQAADHPGVNAVSTGNFALAGTELCRVTKDMKYCDRSYENVWWLDRHMKSDKGTLWDGIDGQTCKVTDWQFTCQPYPSSSPLLKADG